MLGFSCAGLKAHKPWTSLDPREWLCLTKRHYFRWTFMSFGRRGLQSLKCIYANRKRNTFFIFFFFFILSAQHFWQWWSWCLTGRQIALPTCLRRAKKPNNSRVQDSSICTAPKLFPVVFINKTTFCLLRHWLATLICQRVVKRSMPPDQLSSDTGTNIKIKFRKWVALGDYCPEWTKPGGVESGGILKTAGTALEASPINSTESKTVK